MTYEEFIEENEVEDYTPQPVDSGHCLIHGCFYGEICGYCAETKDE